MASGSGTYRSIDNGQIRFVLRSADSHKDGAHLVEAQDGRKPLFAFGMDQFRGVPVALEDI